MSTEIIPLEVAIPNELLSETRAIEQRYSGFNVPAIVSPELRAAVESTLKIIKADQKQLKALEDIYKRPVNDLMTRVRALFRRPIEVTEAAELASKKAIIEYDNEIRRKAAEAARIQQEAENAAAEAKRKELEAFAFAESLFGSMEEAEKIADAALAVQPAKIGTVEIKTDGMRKVWKYRITDINLIPRDYLQPNETMIGQIVRAGKETVRIPGVEVYFEETIAARAG